MFVTVYAAGRYPLGTVSVTRTASSVTVVYTGLPGDAYQPQYEASLIGGAWTNDGPALTADSNGRFTYVDSAQPQSAQRFYRAAASP